MFNLGWLSSQRYSLLPDSPSLGGNQKTTSYPRLSWMLPCIVLVAISFGFGRMSKTFTASDAITGMREGGNLGGLIDRTYDAHRAQVPRLVAFRGFDTGNGSRRTVLTKCESGQCLQHLIFFSTIVPLGRIQTLQTSRGKNSFPTKEATLPTLQSRRSEPHSQCIITCTVWSVYFSMSSLVVRLMLSEQSLPSSSPEH